jgi:hypothetical protein
MHGVIHGGEDHARMTLKLDVQIVRLTSIDRKVYRRGVPQSLEN